MPRLADAFPSKYLAASDLEDGDVTGTILSAEIETLGQGAEKSQKIIMNLKGLKKPFVCNKTNATTISKVLGSDDTDDWIGQRITLGVSEVQFGNDIMPAIRVRLKKPASAQAAQRPPVQAEPETATADDDIPF